MLPFIIIVSCTMASLQNCATATDTHDASSASGAVPSNYTTITTTPILTSSTEYSTTGSTTDSLMPTTSGSLTSTPTSTSTSLSTTTAIAAEANLVTQSLVFAGDYATVVGSAKTRFLEECTAALAGVACVDVHAGSVVVTLRGLRSALTVAMAQLQASGLDLPSFAPLSLETITTSGTLKSTPASASTSLSTTTTIAVEASFVTQSLVFAGDYATVVGSAKTRFLEECTAALTGVACVDVHAGSVVVTLRGLPRALTVAMAQLQASGLDLPSFAPLSLEMIENRTVSNTTSTTTAGITTANATSSQSNAPADDSFFTPVVIIAIAGSAGGLCLCLACCYGVVLCRRRRKRSKEAPQTSEKDEDLDCVVLQIEENPGESIQELKEAASGEMSGKDLDSITLHVEESPQESPEKLKEWPSRVATSQDVASMDRGIEESHQESPLELKEMPNGEAPSRSKPSSPAASRDLPTSPAASSFHATVVGTVVELDEWKLNLADDAPEPLPARCEINRGRTSL